MDGIAGTKPELLAPVQDFVSLRAAIDAGADAVYFGIKGFNMRAGALNFQLSELRRVVGICHGCAVKAYLALNTIIYEAELKRVSAIVRAAKQAGVDAIICWDFAVASECEKLSMPVHLSTQASVSNSGSLLFLKQGLKMLRRVILARECSLNDIRKIIRRIRQDKPGLEIETFIHGAMCLSLSGRCFMSQHIFGKSANRGECIQPCRRKYLVKDVEEAHELELGEDYVMSPNDLCTLPFIEKLIEAGISCFKIEGRNRSPEYVKAVSSAYRRAIDSYFEGKLTAALKEQLIAGLKEVYNRGFGSGFYLGKPIAQWSGAYGSKAASVKEYIGFVANYFRKPSVAEIKVESRGFSHGSRLMFQGPTTGVKEQLAESMEWNHRKMAKAQKGCSVAVKLDFVVRKNDKVFVVSS